jgi:hypothetical protein
VFFCYNNIVDYNFGTFYEKLTRLGFIMGREPRKSTVDKASIYRATDTAKSRINDLRKKLEDADKDVDKKERLDKSLCKHCHYIYNSRMGGAMMTNRECGICKEPQNYSSTATDPLCTPCAKDNDLCKRCGGDINIKHIRKERPFQQK